MVRTLVTIAGTALGLCASVAAAADGAAAPTYEQLRAEFISPDHSQWGEVPLWWWEGERMTRPMVTQELETLAAKGVKSVCPIQRSPGRCDPPSFSPQWWDMFSFVGQECRRLGMTLWAYDQVGYGHYGWLEKAAAKAQDKRTGRLVFLTADGDIEHPVRLELPKGKLVGARAYPLREGVADDAASIDIAKTVASSVLEWTPPEGRWKVAVSVAVPELLFQLSDVAADTFIDMLYGEIERRLGRKAMGTTFAGMFQDEHPPTPRDLYTKRLAETFRQRTGYDIARAIPAQHFDVGPLTPKYRSDFFDAYLAVDEACYWKRVYDWTAKRGLLTSHDNWGRKSIARQSQGYIDYFRTQRWFSAPGYDDAGTAPVSGRNYYDTKIAASIARLYDRPRVWSEAFHSSGWGRTTDQTLSWLSANYAFGANLYDEHGLYYSVRTSTWEHAAPDPHWRQPYWCYYGKLSDWVARMSYMMAQGTHVVDVAVHYPVVSLLAGEPPGRKAPNYNLYMQLSRTVFDAGIDNDIVDDDSILAGRIQGRQFFVAGNGYRALVFGPETTVRRRVLEKALEFANAGGTVVYFGSLPNASTESGRNDPKLKELLQDMFPACAQGELPAQPIRRTTPGGGLLAFVPSEQEMLPQLITGSIDRDIVGANVFVTHRRIGNLDVYLLQNTQPEPILLKAVCRVDGVPEIWDPFTGQVDHVNCFKRLAKTPPRAADPTTGRQPRTLIEHRLEGNTATLLVFRPGKQTEGAVSRDLMQPADIEKKLSDKWKFSVIATRDNRWGEFRWPPSKEKIGPEVRSFRYAEEASQPGTEQGWQRPDFADADWALARYSIGPYWLFMDKVPADADVVPAVLRAPETIRAGATFSAGEKKLSWCPLEFSKTIGLARPAPWGGHSGYPDGGIDQNFVKLPKGRKLLFTRIRSPKKQRLGLRVELRNASARLWVGGVEQPFEDAVGNLPLEQGQNPVLLDLPAGEGGMLYVQAKPPAVESMKQAARGMVAPDFRSAFWIRDASTGAGYVRKRFTLEQVPDEARLIVTAYTGYRLFVNGVKVEEEIGPWAKWTHPESINVTALLRRGKNVIAGWIQVHAGQHVHGAADRKGFALALKARGPSDHTWNLVSDDSWKGTTSEQPGWEQPAFDDSSWQPVVVLGQMGAEPWGLKPLQNIGVVTEPHRRLAIDLPSPYLTCFDEVPDVAYDVKSADDRRIGWYRFTAPPGLRRLHLNTSAKAQVWVDGQPAQVRDGVVHVTNVPTGMSTVAIRLEMEPGKYGGAAFPLPIGLELGGGTIQPGLWSDFALPTYSGIGVYKQVVTLTGQEVGRRTTLDLGQVLVAAELLVNGRSAGVRLARPFKFDVTQLIKPGPNTFEVHVANTIAPHYTVTNHSHNLGPTDSGLLGPVVLRQELPAKRWVRWARSEIAQLQQQLDTSTPKLETAQTEWERIRPWSVLEPISARAASSAVLKTLPDHSIQIPKGGADTYTIRFQTRQQGIKGFRLEGFMDQGRVPDATAPEIATTSIGGEIQISATRLDDTPFRGRFVRVEIPDRSEYLHLAEVQVHSGNKNVALGGVARQSSTSLSAVADRAIDGNTNGSWGGKSVCHTNREHHPWWEVDLGTACEINRIVIHNRTDGELENRLSNFRVTLLDEQRNPVWQRPIAEPPMPKLECYLSPVPVQLVSTSDPASNNVVPSGRLTCHWHAGKDGRCVALLQTAGQVGFPNGTTLTVRMTRPVPPARRLRVSSTTMAPPLYDVPPTIAAILAKSPAQRTDQECTRLAAFYRSIAPQLHCVRERLATLQHQMQQVE